MRFPWGIFTLFLALPESVEAQSTKIETGHEITLARRDLTQFSLANVILLSTLDGSLQARSRDSGAILWTLQSSSLVEVSDTCAMKREELSLESNFRSEQAVNLSLKTKDKFKPRARSTADLHKKRNQPTSPASPLNSGQVLWLAEPSADGSLYFFTPDTGIQQIPASIPELVAKAPFGMVGDIVYTGSRHTTLYAIDGATGEIIQAFGASNDAETSTEANTAQLDPLRVILIGRTEYTLDMHEQIGSPGRRVKVRAWTPNARDQDIAAQYSRPLDGVYVAPLSNRTVMALDENDMRPQRWVSEIPSLLVDVFDVLQSPSDRTLALVKQPPLRLAGAPNEGLLNDLFVAEASEGSGAVVRGPRYSALLNSMPQAAYCNSPELALNTHAEQIAAIVGVHPVWCQNRRNPPANSPANSLLPPSAPKMPLPLLDPPKRGLAPTIGEPTPSAIVPTALVLLASTALVLAYFLLKKRSQLSAILSSSPYEEPKRRKRGARGGTKRRNQTNQVTTNQSSVNQVATNQSAVKQPSVNQSSAGDASTSPNLLSSQPQTEPGVFLTDYAAPLATPPITLSDEVLGYGSHGTTVFKGRFEDRDVAVKRMLLEFYDVASQEVDILRESDDHPNVVRYFYKYQTNQFLYIALELCPGTLEELVRGTRQFSILFDPLDSLRQIAKGLQHLHNLQIVHRDIKPQNILVALPNARARGKRGRKSAPSMGVRYLISDFGLCRKLEGEQSSFLPTVADSMAGTAGWAAPEISAPVLDAETASSTVVHPRLTKAVDIFSAGCLFYYVLTGGKHPFGDLHMRLVNIQQRTPPVLEGGGLMTVEALDLIPKMLDFEPANRPQIADILKHPLFWGDHRKLDFLVRISDRLEHESREEHSDLIDRLEIAAPSVVGLDWHEKFPTIFIDNLGKYRRYHGDRILDLLRALRNKLHHYNDFSPELKQCVGSVPRGYLEFFTNRFPGLLICAYYYAKAEFSEEDAFREFFL